MKRFNAQEALDYGLIDRIVRPPRIKADAPRKDAGTGLGQSKINRSLHFESSTCLFLGVHGEHNQLIRISV